MNTGRLFELIKAYDTITLFRHVSPDSDALNSQFALRQFIREEYPRKKVYACGFEQPTNKNLYPELDQVEDEVIQNALAIVLDTANKERIDDPRWEKAAYVLRVDHHIIIDDFGDESIIDDLYGATCEIIAYAFMENQQPLSKEIAQFLYRGILSDTLRFSIPSITSTTMRIAAFLIDAGVAVAKANEDCFLTNRKLFEYENFIRSKYEFKEGIAYAIVYKNDYENLGLSFQEAKEKVHVLSNVSEFKAWALFVEKESSISDHPTFNGSLRSRGIAINEIANQYRGGGHRFACGVKDCSLSDIDCIVFALIERIKSL